MTVLIMHPNDELFFADLQKELIAALFCEERIIYSQIPLWIELGEIELKAKFQIRQVQVEELCVKADSVNCNVRIQFNDCKIVSKLTLVCLHKGKMFTDEEIDVLKEKPVRQLKVFRLGLVQEQGPHTKSISKSVWCKIK